MLISEPKATGKHSDCTVLKYLQHSSAAQHSIQNVVLVCYLAKVLIVVRPEAAREYRLQAARQLADCSDKVTAAWGCCLLGQLICRLCVHGLASVTS